MIELAHPKVSSPLKELLAKGAGPIVAALLLCYLGMLAYACPRQELIAAILFEIACFGFFFCWRRTRRNVAAKEAKAIVLDHLTPAGLALGCWRNAVVSLKRA